MTAAMAMYAHIYGSSNGHVCALSMGAAMAMYAHIYGSSNGHVCAYLWATYTRISIAVIMAM